MSKKQEKRTIKKEMSWEKKVATSNGMMVLIPKDFEKKTTEYNEVHEKMLQEEKSFSRKVEDFKFSNEKFWYELKRKIDEDGKELPGGCEMGLNKEALKDGVFIINLIPKNQDNGPMRM